MAKVVFRRRVKRTDDRRIKKELKLQNTSFCRVPCTCTCCNGDLQIRLHHKLNITISSVTEKRYRSGKCDG